MLIKTTYENVVMPVPDKETGKLSVIADTDGNPFAIKFENEKEMKLFLSNIMNALCQGHNMICFYDTSSPVDNDKFCKDMKDFQPIEVEEVKDNDDVKTPQPIKMEQKVTKSKKGKK